MLDPDQLLAVTAPLDRDVLVVSCAGSGKTALLVSRIVYLIEQGVSPSEILAVTFTRKAAGELKARVAQQVGRSGLTASTFHAWAFHYVRRHGPLIGLRPGWRVASGSQRLGAVRATLNDLKIDRDPEETLSRLDRLRVKGNGPEELAEEDASLLPILAGYVERLRNARLLDFTDLILSACHVMQEVPRRFKHVLVDEAQDVTPVQLQLLNAWREGGHLFAVGDDAQAIFSYAGADASNLSGMARDKTVLVYSVTRNYRSSGNIVRASLPLLKNRKSGIRKRVRSMREAGNPIECVRAFSTAEEAKFIADRIAADLKKGLQPNEIAVLVRTAWIGPPMEMALWRRGIAFQTGGEASLLRRVGVRRAIKRLSDRGDPAAAARDEIGRCLKSAQRVTRKALLAYADAIEDAEDGCRLVDLRSALGKMPGEDGIVLSTVHGAKGLEFDTVYVLGATADTFPYDRSVSERGDEGAEEERRLFYVAVTRARNRLVITYPGAKVSRDGRVRRMRESPYLAELRKGVGAQGWLDLEV